MNPRAAEFYYLALSGQVVTVEAVPDEQGVTYPDSERTLRLPTVVPTQAGVDPTSWHRVALAHRALHHELGSFAFEAQRAHARIAAGVAAMGEESRSELERFLACFGDRHLAILLFTILEELRIDSALPRAMPGLAHAHERMRRAAAASRPSLATMASRAAAVEFLVRCSLAVIPETVPAPIGAAAATLAALAEPLRRPAATVEDAANATVQAYTVVARLPNLGVLQGRSEVRPALGHEAAPWPSSWPETARTAIEGDTILRVAVAQVAYRDDLSARLVMAPPAPAPNEQAVYRWTAEPFVAAPSGTSLPGPPEPLPHEHHEVMRELNEQVEGPLARRGPNEFLYPEWDAPRARLVGRWCRIIEETARESDPQHVTQLQQAHQLLVSRLRRLMQLTVPRAYVRQRGVADGDDLDLDASVDALVDLRAGRSPRDGVYEALRPRRRSVAVGLLLDASSSTGERLEDAPPLLPSPDPRCTPGYRDRPRVLDLEILSALLCLSAIDAVGDACAAWSFSGTGRAQVRVSTLKALHEPMTAAVFRRAAALRPGHATRLGAAIRHTAARLSRSETATRVLIVLTDGCPYDIDYGQQYGEVAASDYAVEDTVQALAAAETGGVRPFLLAIGADGAQMPLAAPPYGEALDDVTLLPQRLTRLYRDLTTNRLAAGGGAHLRRGA